MITMGNHFFFKVLYISSEKDTQPLAFILTTMQKYVIEFFLQSFDTSPYSATTGGHPGFKFQSRFTCGTCLRHDSFVLVPVSPLFFVLNCSSGLAVASK